MGGVFFFHHSKSGVLFPFRTMSMLYIKIKDGAGGTPLAGGMICGSELWFDEQEKVGSRRCLKSRGEKLSLHSSDSYGTLECC